MKKKFWLFLLGGMMTLINTQNDGAMGKEGREVSSQTEHYWLVIVDGKEVKHGAYRAMHPDGSPKIEGEYKNGQKEGTWTTYGRNGKKIEEIGYKNDKKCGLCQAWSANSGKLIYRGAYSDGKPIGIHEKWYDDGKKSSECIFKNTGADTVMEEVHWHVNGKKKAHYHYINGQHHGSYERWFMDGAPQEMGVYDNGKRVGEWKRWNSKGEETVKTY